MVRVFSILIAVISSLLTAGLLPVFRFLQQQISLRSVRGAVQGCVLLVLLVQAHLAIQFLLPLAWWGTWGLHSMFSLLPLFFGGTTASPDEITESQSSSEKPHPHPGENLRIHLRTHLVWYIFTAPWFFWSVFLILWPQRLEYSGPVIFIMTVFRYSGLLLASFWLLWEFALQTCTRLRFLSENPFRLTVKPSIRSIYFSVSFWLPLWLLLYMPTGRAFIDLPWGFATAGAKAWFDYKWSVGWIAPSLQLIWLLALILVWIRGSLYFATSAPVGRTNIGIGLNSILLGFSVWFSYGLYAQAGADLALRRLDRVTATDRSETFRRRAEIADFIVTRLPGSSLSKEIRNERDWMLQLSNSKQPLPAYVPVLEGDGPWQILYQLLLMRSQENPYQSMVEVTRAYAGGLPHISSIHELQPILSALGIESRWSWAAEIKNMSLMADSQVVVVQTANDWYMIWGQAGETDMLHIWDPWFARTRSTRNTLSGKEEQYFQAAPLRLFPHSAMQNQLQATGGLILRVFLKPIKKSSLSSGERRIAAFTARGDYFYRQSDWGGALSFWESALREKETKAVRARLRTLALIQTLKKKIPAESEWIYPVHPQFARGKYDYPDSADLAFLSDQMLLDLREYNGVACEADTAGVCASTAAYKVILEAQRELIRRSPQNAAHHLGLVFLQEQIQQPLKALQSGINALKTVFAEPTDAAYLALSEHTARLALQNTRKPLSAEILQHLPPIFLDDSWAQGENLRVWLQQEGELNPHELQELNQALYHKRAWPELYQKRLAAENDPYKRKVLERWSKRTSAPEVP